MFSKNTIAVVSLLMLLSTCLITNQAFAQDKPTEPVGSSLLYVPLMLKAEHKAFGLPEMAIINGTKTATDEKFCGDLLTPTSISTKSEYCLPGAYIGITQAGSRYGVTNAYWDGVSNPVGFGGPAQGSKLGIRNAGIELGFPINAKKLDFSNTDVQVFELNLGGSTRTTSVHPNTDLLLRLSRMTSDVALGHPLYVSASTLVYSKWSEVSTTLGALCGDHLQGQTAWPWYIMFHEVVGVPGSVKVGGWWSLGTDPWHSGDLAACMGDYRFIKLNSLYEPQYVTWRESVLNDPDIPMTGISSYQIPQWYDDDYGGQWVVTVASYGTGALLITKYVLSSGVSVVTNAFVIFPTEIVRCMMTPDIPYELCRVQDTLN